MELLNEKGYVSKSAFDLLIGKSKQFPNRADDILQTVAELIRFNTLLSVARAGTGHLGASLSIVELLTEIYFRSFDMNPKKLTSNDRDIFILSKGHAAPALYATLAAKGFIDIDDLDRLRRLHGLPGHCDVSTFGIEANTGSLAMGLSKAIGYAIAKKRFNLKGEVVVIVGDGELQEGQCWEAFLSAVSYNLDNLLVIVDVNEVQTDELTRNIVNYGNLPRVFNGMGFATYISNGQKVKDIYQAIQKLRKINNKPKLFYCHTVKGRGVNYMEYPNVLKNVKDRYIWHNKAPNKVQLEEALSEIFSRIEKILNAYKLDWDLDKALTDIPKEPVQKDIEGVNLISAFSKAIVDLGEKYKNIVIFDADLEEDCGFIDFHEKFKRRFFEMGIMEQHMVSAACAISRLGYIPVIGSYAAFLTSRANEQIYNLASEGGRALIAGNMAGVIPATPGKSHQGFRDIACMKNIPNITIYQPVSAADVRNILARYFKKELGNILYLRLSIAASAVNLATPNAKLKRGSPQIILKGEDALIIGSGPVILGECIKSAEFLFKKGIKVEIWNHPWIIDFNKESFLAASKRHIPLIIIEDHYIKGGMGESLLSFLQKEGIGFKSIKHIALTKFPETGFREEALASFKIDRFSIIRTIVSLIKR